MKKILFIIEDLKFGGVEASLVNLLNCIDFDAHDYSITLLMWGKHYDMLDGLKKDKHIKAAELSAGLLMEKMPGVEIAGFPVAFSNLPPERIAAIVSTLKDGIGDVFNSIMGVVTNKEKDTAKISEGLNALVAVEKELNSSISDSEALKNAMSSIKRG